MEHKDIAHRIANKVTPRYLLEVLQTGYHFNTFVRYGEGQLYPIRLDDQTVEDIMNAVRKYLEDNGYDNFIFDSTETED